MIDNHENNESVLQRQELNTCNTLPSIAGGYK